MRYVTGSTIVVVCGVLLCVALLGAQVVLDVSGSNADPAVADMLRAAVVATLAAIAAARVAADAKTGKQ